MHIIPKISPQLYLLTKFHVQMVYDSKDIFKRYTTRKVSKYGVISGPYFPVFGLNTGKYGPEITPYLDNFHAVVVFLES